MRLSIQSYFDIGRSYGLGDDAFRAPAGSPGQGRDPEEGPDRQGIDTGFVNPLGRGVVCPLAVRAPEALKAWRQAALRLSANPDIEFGFMTEDEAERARVHERVRELIE